VAALIVSCAAGMNIFELLAFLIVTGGIGAAAGLVAGLVAGVGSKWVGTGAVAGPVVAAFGIAVWLCVLKVRKCRASKTKE
jgi:hypothetical protein